MRSVFCSHWHKSPSGVLMCAWYKSMIKIGQQTKARCFLPEVSKVTFYQTQWSQEWILSFLMRKISIPNAHVSSVDLQETMVSVQLKRFSSIDRLYETNFVANSSAWTLSSSPLRKWWATKGIWTVLPKILGMPPYLSLVADQKKK